MRHDIIDLTILGTSVTGVRVLCAAAIAVSASLVLAQTKVTPPANKYPVSQDVTLGREAADEARKQLPIMNDSQVSAYIDGLGQRLAAAIPPELRHPEFRYTFEAVNVRDINAFALPGGPMFVNRGILEAAGTEGEVAGVIAHEISHVVLRHGTAQASKAGKYQAGQVAGAVLGAIIGGRVGSVVAQGTQFGIGASFMRFGREYEKQADLQGAQIMALAGYDAREMANMFKTIEKEGGSNGPEWLSDHPNPGNRYGYILKEAEALKVANPIGVSEGFDRVRAHLRTLPKAPTTAEATKEAAATGASSEGAPPSGRVDPPSTRYQNYTEGNVFQISVPSNWRELTTSGSVTFSPNGAFGTYQGHRVFTHGVEVGISRSSSADLRQATNDFIASLASGNPRLSAPSGYQNISLDGRRALQTSLGNVAESNGRDEVIQLVTTLMRDGRLFYALSVVPRDEANDYQATFQRVIGSLRIRD